MTRFAIDAPTLLEIVRDGRTVSSSHQLVAPSSVRSQALNLLLAAVQAGNLTDEEALSLQNPITELKVRTLGDRVSRRVAWNLAREHHWDDLRDAEYLAIAQLQADALVTVDRDLKIKATGLVKVKPFAALFV